MAETEYAIPVVIFGPAGESGRPAFMSWPTAASPDRPRPSQDVAAEDDDEELSSPLFIALVGALVGFLAAFVLAEVGRYRRAIRSAEAPTTGDRIR